MDVKESLKACGIRGWTVQRVEEHMRLLPNRDVVVEDDFLQIFKELGRKQSMILFSSFAEVNLFAKKRRAGFLSLFTGLCLLTEKSSDEEKYRFLFRLFDMNKTSSMTVDECCVFLTCLLRALGSICMSMPKVLRSSPDDLDAFAEIPFKKFGVMYLTWGLFKEWIPTMIATILEEARLPTGSPTRFSKRYAFKQENERHPDSSEEGRNAVECASIAFEEESYVDKGSQNQEDDDEEGLYLDVDNAMDQILELLPEIDQGDFSNLPWVLDSVRMIAEYDECATLRRIINRILPFLCNVAAASEEEDLSVLAFHCISMIIEATPEKLTECASILDSRALFEMCLLRSCERPNSEVSLAAAACLIRLVTKQPYGFAVSLTALLEAGTLHENNAVMVQCAAVLGQLLERSLENLTVDMEGRLDLLLSALCVWAHGDVPECRHCAKLVVVRLGIRFGEDERWDTAIEETESVLLRAWNQGYDPGDEEIECMEAEFQREKRRQEMLNEEKDELDQNIAQRGWLIATGFRAGPNSIQNASMYPQVFAYLGFRGRGGPSVGILWQSTFDTTGALRKRETVQEIRTVEWSKVCSDGRVKVWREAEVNVREVTRLEAVSGEFAHREKIRARKLEFLDGKQLSKESEKQDFIHFKNEIGEIQTTVDICSPTSPQIASPFGFQFEQRPGDEDEVFHEAQAEVSNVAIGSPGCRFAATQEGDEVVCVVQEPEDNEDEQDHS